MDYHLTNICIHLFTFLIFWFFLQKLLYFYQRKNKNDILNPLPAPFFIAIAAGLWVLNPVQTNSVTYIVQRMTSLCALFYLATLAFYLSGRQESILYKKVLFFSLTVTCALCAFMSKETSITLPLAIIMLEYYFISQDFIIDFLKKIKPVYWVISFVLILLIIPLAEEPFRNLVLNGYRMRTFSIWERLLTESRVVVWYISLLFYPIPSRMNLDHDFTISSSLLDPISTLLAILIIGGTILFAFITTRRNPLLSFGILWFFLNLIIESTIIPLEIVFEHRLYLPSIGLFIAIAHIIAKTIETIQTKYHHIDIKGVAIVIIIMLLSFNSILTTIRNNDWYNIFTIYEDCYKKSPDKPRTIANLGLAYGQMGDQEKARRYFREAIDKGDTFNEEYISSVNNIITSYLNDNMTQEALSEGEKLFKNIPPNANMIGLPTMYYTLGIAYQKNQKPELALESFKEALKSRSNKHKEQYIYNALSLILSEIADSSTSEIFSPQHKNNTKRAYVMENMFHIAVDARDYFLAKSALDALKEIDENKFNSLGIFLNEEKTRNTEAKFDSDINNHSLFQSDVSYRVLISTVNFINRHYSPLKFMARNILEILKKKYPDDRFVWELSLGMNFQGHISDTNKIETINKIVEKYNDFPPILSLSAKLYMVVGENNKALESINRLLEIYPDHPHWLYWEQARTKLRMKMKK
ncbi:MAG: tetratricopeptide repeat protein [Proteobacteria bacterium]|nr:tetratricopeptide repeat protein [Pseudomonadota bacterium]MBU1739232.1 tetratricopeptide repeat protein [Pseudomonadota bacterium]